MIDLCKQASIQPIVHFIADGRDSAQKSAKQYLAKIQPALDEANGRIATVHGRYYAMDRDHRWERVELSWKAMAMAEGRQAVSVEAAIDDAYSRDETDEFFIPTVIEGHKPLSADSEVFFFNYRNDRPREISEALAIESFEGFE